MSDYRSKEGLSGSALKHLARSPMHYKQGVDNPIEPTEAMSFGTLVHLMVLEPDKFDEQYIVMPEGMIRRGKEYDALLAEAGDRELIKAKDYETALAMKEAVYAHPMASKILRNITAQIEHEVLWEEDGVACKGKLDVWLEDLNIVVDYKSCVDASPDEFKWVVKDSGYTLQLAHYQAAKKKGELLPSAVIIAQEKTAPYAVCVYEIGQVHLDYAHTKRKELLQVYKTCMETGEWGGYSKEIVTL